MFTYALGTRKTPHGEYIIRCFRDDKRYPDGDYYTTDKNDAVDSLVLLEKAEITRQRVAHSKDKVFLADIKALDIDNLPMAPLSEAAIQELKAVPVVKWPPILMRGNEVYDGVARVKAAHMLGATHIPARRV